MIEELKITSVFERGIPNKEGVAIRVNEASNLMHYWLGVGLRQSPNHIYPLNDNLLWLGQGWVLPGDWIYVYTGKGEPREVALPYNKARVFTLHWGRSGVLFSAPQVFPYLINAAVVGLPEEMEQGLSSGISDSQVTQPQLEKE